MTEETLPVVDVAQEALNGEVQAAPPMAVGDMYLSQAAFEHIQRVAKVFANSKLVPEAYRGNLADCIIAIQMAKRLKIDPFTFMQNSAIVHGKPGLEGKLIIGLINSSGLFAHPLMFDYTGTGDSRAVLCWTTDAQGRRYEQTFSLKEAKTWGWYDKTGSPWPKMPDQMLAYRSATFFSRKYCPEVTLGLPPRDELEDIAGVYSNPPPPIVTMAASPEQPSLPIGETPKSRGAK